ncbi:netrin-4 [Stigmatopora nigra]
MFGKGEHQMLLLLLALVWVFWIFPGSEAVSRCANHACSPPIRNLATGRTLVTLSGSCGNTSLEQSTCHHPLGHMNDDPFLHPNTWWESSAKPTVHGTQDQIRLDLKTHFCLSHVVLLFRSPRPAAMAVERSTDFGKSWEVLKVFAHNCSMEFGLPDDFNQPGSLCTSRYSSAAPCSGGEVILRILDPSNSKQLDPYSPEALARLTLTNLRVRLLKAQTCPGLQAASKDKREATSASYAVYNLLAQGTCLCHGHAELCLARETQRGGNMVSGQCVCTHHTAGFHCEKCAALYNDRPWRPANGSSGDANPCQKCECHDHTDSCHFSQRAWLSSGGQSGGICDNCRHNTFGRRCQRCRRGHYRHPTLPVSSPHTCQRCKCDTQGSLSPHPGDDETWCHPRTGQCRCKNGVGGTSCTHCMPGYWGFGAEGCKACTCPNSCNPLSGQCLESDVKNQLFDIPIGGKIPVLDSQFSVDEEAQWQKEQAVSALHTTGKCICKERKLRSVSDLCKVKHDYVIKASVMSAHDKGSHAEVLVKVRKVLRAGLVELYSGTVSIFPLSWTSRGCTCPILNPGMDYLLAGPEEITTGRLLVTMQSAVIPWTPKLGLLITEGLRSGCP